MSINMEHYINVVIARLKAGLPVTERVVLTDHKLCNKRLYNLRTGTAVNCVNVYKVWDECWVVRCELDDGTFITSGYPRDEHIPDDNIHVNSVDVFRREYIVI